MKNKEKIAIAIIIILAVAFILNVATQDDRRWNDGVCPDCGANWELVKEIPSHHGNGAAEIWQCPHCHKTITLGGSKEILAWIYIILDTTICVGMYKIINKIYERRRKNMRNTKFIKGIVSTYAAKIVATIAGTARIIVGLFGLSLINPEATFMANLTTGVACGLAAIICGKIAVHYAKWAVALEKKY